MRKMRVMGKLAVLSLAVTSVLAETGNIVLRNDSPLVMRYTCYPHDDDARDRWEVLENGGTTNCNNADFVVLKPIGGRAVAHYRDECAAADDYHVVYGGVMTTFKSETCGTAEEESAE